MAEANRRTFLKGATAVALGGPTGLSATGAQAVTATDHEAFMGLSVTLTGLTEAELPSMVEQNDSMGVRLNLYELYFERLRSSYPAEFRELLAVWREVEDKPDQELALSERLAGTDSAAGRLRVAARQVVKIWFLSTIDDPRTRLDPKNGRNSGQLGGDLGQYQNSAVWKLIGAPVSGYSNFAHGYWVNKPTIAEASSIVESLAPRSSDMLIPEASTSMELPDG